MTRYRLGAFDGHVVLAPAADFEAAVDASGGESLGFQRQAGTESLGNFEDDGLATFFSTSRSTRTS